MENKKIITGIENKNGGKLNQYKSPYKNEKVAKTKNTNYIEVETNNFIANNPPNSPPRKANNNNVTIFTLFFLFIAKNLSRPP